MEGEHMTQEALKKMYQLLLTEPHAPTVCAQLERIAREALAEHAMREAQRLGQEIEQEPVAWVKEDVCDGQYIDGRPRKIWWECNKGVGTAFYTRPPQRTEQEPVAIKRMKEWIEYLKRKSDFGQNMKIPSEMSAGTCWELAIELEQFINTAPPQRTWVGLTDKDWNRSKHNYDFQKGVDWAELILKEKNT
jgi:hypothetical protein